MGVDLLPPPGLEALRHAWSDCLRSSPVVACKMALTDIPGGTNLAILHSRWLVDLWVVCRLMCNDQQRGSPLVVEEQSYLVVDWAQLEVTEEDCCHIDHEQQVLELLERHEELHLAAGHMDPSVETPSVMARACHFAVGIPVVRIQLSELQMECCWLEAVSEAPVAQEVTAKDHRGDEPEGQRVGASMQQERAVRLSR